MRKGKRELRCLFFLGNSLHVAACCNQPEILSVLLYEYDENLKISRASLARDNGKLTVNTPLTGCVRCKRRLRHSEGAGERQRHRENSLPIELERERHTYL